MSVGPGRGKKDPTPVRIEYAEADKLCMRISIGGLPGMGYYATLRPGPDGFDDYARVLEVVLELIRQAERRGD